MYCKTCKEKIKVMFWLQFGWSTSISEKEEETENKIFVSLNLKFI